MSNETEGTPPIVEATTPEQIAEAERAAEVDDQTGLDESEKDDQAGAPAAEAPITRPPGVNTPYGAAGETGAQAFQRQHREATGEEPPEPV